MGQIEPLPVDGLPAEIMEQAEQAGRTGKQIH